MVRKIHELRYSQESDTLCSFGHFAMVSVIKRGQGRTGLNTHGFVQRIQNSRIAEDGVWLQVTVLYINAYLSCITSVLCKLSKRLL